MLMVLLLLLRVQGKGCDVREHAILLQVQGKGGVRTAE
jgi:hypothetical protein